MTSPGHVVLFRFPQADQQRGKLRPALVLTRLPSDYPDWLVCMISSQLRHEVPDLDEIIRPDEPDFESSGLRMESLIRVTRLAVVEEDALLGSIGKVAPTRLHGIRDRLAAWLSPHPENR